MPEALRYIAALRLTERARSTITLNVVVIATMLVAVPTLTPTQRSQAFEDLPAARRRLRPSEAIRADILAPENEAEGLLSTIVDGGGAG